MGSTTSPLRSAIARRTKSKLAAEISVTIAT
jgi:hypothetical protein